MKNAMIVHVILGCRLLLAPFDASGTPVSASNEHPSCAGPAPPLLHVSGIRNWYLIGNALTPGNDTVTLRVAQAGHLRAVEVRLDDQPKGNLSQAAGAFTGTIDIAGLAPGKHAIQLIAEGSSKFTQDYFFQRSHPFYALLTTDWDTSDSRNSVLELHENLHKVHPSLKMTHFLGPYTFTDRKVSPARQAYLARWMLRLSETFQDEIGLHIHPYCNFVNSVRGVHCRSKPSDTFRRGDASGYTVLSSAYSEAEFLRLLQAADALFVAHGLGKPTSFRAGSWAAGARTLKALAADGFVADSSANNWARIREESKNDGNGVLYNWNRQHWKAINDHSQPYFPDQFEPMSHGIPVIPLLEVPDNGSLVDYVTSNEMISIFKANWQGQSLAKPVTYVFGFHPVSYSMTFHKRIEMTLNYIDRFLAANDDGPVVYETLSHMARVFRAPPH